jgi:hypothetical protein
MKWNNEKNAVVSNICLFNVSNLLYTQTQADICFLAWQIKIHLAQNTLKPKRKRMYIGNIRVAADSRLVLKAVGQKIYF